MHVLVNDLPGLTILLIFIINNNNNKENISEKIGQKILNSVNMNSVHKRLGVVCVSKLSLSLS